MTGLGVVGRPILAAAGFPAGFGGGLHLDPAALLLCGAGCQPAADCQSAQNRRGTGKLLALVAQALACDGSSYIS
jgi:hypothetical protein